MKNILCFILGHNLKEVAYIDPGYKVYVCQRCGKSVRLKKLERNKT